MANVNFVRSLATRYLREGIEHEDLVSEGVVGLLEAADRFDPERGIKFITYGAWWAKRAMLRHLRTFGQAVHVPKYKHHELVELRRLLSRLTQDLGRPPSLPEIEKASGASAKELAELLSLAAPTRSLDDEEDPAPASPGASPEELLVAADATRRALGLLPGLPERERRVLERRFGLDGQPHQTLAALGGEMGLTKERVRQIEKEACRRLRGCLEAAPVAA
jgi:RNA polymerase sigma factor (sigma-70 family)